jgi:SecD/SecF fusion protein
VSRHLGWRLLAVLLLLGAAGWVAVTRPPRLGLDLRGGTQIVLEATERPDLPVDETPWPAPWRCCAAASTSSA